MIGILAGLFLLGGLALLTTNISASLDTSSWPAGTDGLLDFLPVIFVVVGIGAALTWITQD